VHGNENKLAKMWRLAYLAAYHPAWRKRRNGENAWRKAAIMRRLRNAVISVGGVEMAAVSA